MVPFSSQKPEMSDSSRFLWAHPKLLRARTLVHLSLEAVSGMFMKRSLETPVSQSTMYLKIEKKICSRIIMSPNSKINKRCLQGTSGPALKSNETLSCLSERGEGVAPTCPLPIRSHQLAVWMKLWAVNGDCEPFWPGLTSPGARWHYLMNHLCARQGPESNWLERFV